MSRKTIFDRLWMRDPASTAALNCMASAASLPESAYFSAEVADVFAQRFEHGEISDEDVLQYLQEHAEYPLYDETVEHLLQQPGRKREAAIGAMLFYAYERARVHGLPGEQELGALYETVHQRICP